MYYFTTFLLSASLYTIALFSMPSAAMEDFDPFATTQTTAIGKQLLTIAESARHDKISANKRYQAININDTSALDTTTKVANILAIIALEQANNNHQIVAQRLTDLKVLAKQENSTWIAVIYQEKSALQAMRLGQYQLAADHASTAIELAQNIGYAGAIANARATRAVALSKLSKSSEALQDYIQALKYFQDNQQFVKLATLYANQVTLYLDRQDYQQALIMSDKAIAVLSQLTSPPGKLIAATQINKAIALAYLGQKDQELSAYLAAQKFALQADDKEILASIYANISDYFLRYENYSLAIERAMRCIEITQQINQVNLHAICLLNQGIATVYSGETDKGLDVLNQAYELAKSHAMNSTLIDVYTAFVDAYTYLQDQENIIVWTNKKAHALVAQKAHDKAHNFTKLEQQMKQTMNAPNAFPKASNHNENSSAYWQNVEKFYHWIVVFCIIMVVIVGIVILRIKRDNN